MVYRAPWAGYCLDRSRSEAGLSSFSDKDSTDYSNFVVLWQKQMDGIFPKESLIFVTSDKILYFNRLFLTFSGEKSSVFLPLRSGAVPPSPPPFGRSCAPSRPLRALSWTSDPRRRGQRYCPSAPAFAVPVAVSVACSRKSCPLSPSSFACIVRICQLFRTSVCIEASIFAVMERMVKMPST